MIKRLVLVFGAVMVLGFFYYLFTTAEAAISANGLFPDLSGGVLGPVMGVPGALSTVDFSQFGKDGSGWKYVTQGYGDTPGSYMYLDHWHNGIDIAAAYDASVLSPASGEVVATGDQDDFCPHVAFGRFVVIYDPSARVVLMFAHLNHIYVAPGAQVAKGAKIATVGATGLETGVHLHFSVYDLPGFSMAPAHGCGPYPHGKDIDPVPYLKNID